MIKKLIFFLFTVFFFQSCTNDKIELIVETNFPDDVNEILTTKCAVSGCHNTTSAGNANGLDFSSWDKMFNGGKNGSSVIPYSTDYSYMLYFVNTYNDLGLVQEPAMPLGGAPLSRSEVSTLISWVANGAPDKNGKIKFSDNPNREKIYIPNQGCDQVAVLDAEKKVIMRYVKVGIDDNTIEVPHQIRVSHDRKFWYVVFVNGNYIQKFNAETDQLVSTITLANTPGYNTLILSPDGTKAIACDWANTNFITYIDLVNNTMLNTDINGFTISKPHGTHITQNNMLYVTSNTTGNRYYKIDLNSSGFDITNLYLENPNIGSDLNPHDIYFTPDESKYLITCQTSNEVRIFQTTNDSLLAVINVGTFPQEVVTSSSQPYAFVTCQEDGQFGTGKKGSVYVINYNTLTLATAPINVYPAYQPHGIGIDETRGLVYVAGRNVSIAGPPPHHTTACGGRNGNVVAIDMATMQLLQVKLNDDFATEYTYKNELLSDPYFVAFR